MPSFAALERIGSAICVDRDQSRITTSVASIAASNAAGEHLMFDTVRATHLPGQASRRRLLTNLTAAGVGWASGAARGAPRVSAGSSMGTLTSNTVTTSDGTLLYYKDWGSGPVVVFSHGYPLSSDAWENQMLFLAERGYRVVAHDRRGFGRSSQSGTGYDFDTFADDLATLIEALDLKNVTLVGNSMGGGEVARYIGRHGTQRVARVALVAAVTPFMLKTPANPQGIPIEVFDGFRRGVLADRSQWNMDTTLPYYNFNRPGASVSTGVRDAYWRQAQATGMMAAYHAIGAFSETDFRDDLRKITVPTLIVHGSDDQIVPLEISGTPTNALVADSRLIVYEGGSHGLIAIDKARVNADLLEFLRSRRD